MSEFVLVKWIVRVLRWSFWLYRKISPPDFIVASFLVVLNFILIIFNLFTYNDYVRNALGLTEWFIFWTEVLLLGLSAIGFLFIGAYLYRLRIMGICSADSSIENGFDYKAALNSVNEGFDFIGVGASKLTSQVIPFKNALENASKHQKIVRILLCDPRSDSIEAIERRAGVDIGRFKLNVKQSFTFLENQRGRFPAVLEIRLYNPLDEDHMPPFRMMLINGERCLISQFVIGAQKEGRLLPQLHIHRGAPGNAQPNFYRAYEILFNQWWEHAKIITDLDFREIEQISVTNQGRYKNA